MKMKKDIMSVLPIFIMAFGLIGCGSTVPTANENMTEDSTEIVEGNTEETEEITEIEETEAMAAPVSTATSTPNSTLDSIATSEPTPKPTVEPASTPHTHSYTEAATVQATCSTAGEKKLTCSCGDTKTEAIPATGNHNWVAVTQIVHHESLGHVEQVQVQVGTTEVRHEYECKYCGARFNTPEEKENHCAATDVFDHAFAGTIIYDYPGEPIYETQSKWVVDKEAYDSEEIVGYKCSVCGATK